SEEHTSELQSRSELVCRLLLEKKESFPFYGPAPDNTEFAGSKNFAFLAFYGAQDQRFNPTQPVAKPALYFFFNDTETTEIYTLSLHDALPISGRDRVGRRAGPPDDPPGGRQGGGHRRSEEHTSELQSRSELVCRLLLEKK